MTWNVTTDEEVAGVAYMAQVSHVTTSPCQGSATMLTPVSSTLTQDVSGLAIGFTYHFSIRMMGPSEATCQPSTSAAVLVKLAEDKPASSPTFDLTVVDSTSIRISWVAPSCQGRNGDLTNYQILYRRVAGQIRANQSRTDAEQTITFPAISDSLIFTLRGLEPSITYSFVMLASTAQGAGARSASSSATTLVGGQ